ncbi:MAG: hypothetical protein AB7I30_16720 [Isosphaeraceae bacterium]
MKILESLRRVMALGLVAPAVLPLLARADEPPTAVPVPATSAPAPVSDSVEKGANPGATRSEPPVAPRKYLEAGARLFNTERFELAATYLRAAHLYRERLTPSERIVLDVYREKLAAYLKKPAPTTPPVSPRSTDSGVVPTATVVDPVKALSRRPDPLEAEIFRAISSPGPVGASDDSPTLSPEARPKTDAGGGSRGSATWRDTSDTKQKARWLLQLAREQILKRNFEVAAQAIAEARGMDVKWTVFDETPERLTEALEEARDEAGPTPSGDRSVARDRKTAKARLRAAREAIQTNDLDRAEAIVREVRSWGVGFNLFDDTPDRVAATIHEARYRAALRSAELSVKSYQFPMDPRVAPPQSSQIKK